MADNIAVTPGSGATIATDEITWGGSTVHAPLGKMIIGADGAAETLSRGQQTAANGLPVTLASDQITVAALGDGIANPTTILTGSCLMVWDAGDWNRVQTGASDGTGSGNKVPTTMFMFNGTNFDRVTGTVANGLDVDVTRMPATFAEDAVAASGDTGVLILGVRNDAAAARTSGDGDYGSLALDSAGRLGIADLGGSITVDGSVSLAAATSGGLTPYKLLSAATTNATSVKGSAGQLSYLHVTNRHASAVYYLKLFNKATAPTVGTDTPVQTYPIPPSFGGFNIALSPGLDFSLGIGLSITAGVADLDTAAVTANDVVVNLGYK